MALKDALIVIKEDGVFYIAGETITTGSALQTLDNTTICLAPRSVVRLNNEIYMLSNQGFVRLNSNGVNVISYPIEPTVKAVQLLANMPTLTVATGFERDRSYICWVPESASDTTASLAFVYNIFRRQWSVWTKPARAAVIASGKLFVGSGWENKVLVQRDAGDKTDLSDEEISITISAASGTQLTLDYGFTSAALKAGFTVHQGDTTAVVTSIVSKAGSTYVVALDGNADVFTAGAATVRIPIDIHVRHHPNTCGSPGLTKTFLDFGFVLDKNTVSQITLEVMGNENGILTEIPVTRVPDGDYGTAPLGLTAWGDAGTQRSIPLRENVPNQHITGEWLTIGIKHSVSQERFGLVYSYITYQIATDVNSAG